MISTENNLFDDFIVMQILNDSSDDENIDDEIEDGADLEELEENLEQLRDELATLQDELLTVECNEPSDCLSDAYTRWEARKDLLEEQIFDVEAVISELEDQFVL